MVNSGCRISDDIERHSFAGPGIFLAQSLEQASSRRIRKSYSDVPDATSFHTPSLVQRETCGDPPNESRGPTSRFLDRCESEVLLSPGPDADEIEWQNLRRFTIIVGRRREWTGAFTACGLRVGQLCNVFDEVWWPLLTAEIAPEVNRSSNVSLAMDAASILRGLGVPSREFLQRLFVFDGAPAACSFGHFFCCAWHFAMAADDDLPKYLFALYGAERDDACSLVEVARMVNELCGRRGETEVLPDLCNRLFRVPLERVKDAAAQTVERAAFARVVSSKDSPCSTALLQPVLDARAKLRCEAATIGARSRHDHTRPTRPCVFAPFHAHLRHPPPGPRALALLFSTMARRCSDAVMGDAFWAALADEGRPHPLLSGVRQALSKAYNKVADSPKLRERDEAELVRARKVGVRDCDGVTGHQEIGAASLARNR